MLTYSLEKQFLYVPENTEKSPKLRVRAREVYK
jgi:hypothetical protein